MYFKTKIHLEDIRPSMQMITVVNIYAFKENIIGMTQSVYVSSNFGKQSWVYQAYLIVIIYTYKQIDTLIQPNVVQI